MFKVVIKNEIAKADDCIFADSTEGDIGAVLRELYASLAAAVRHRGDVRSRNGHRRLLDHLRARPRGGQ